MRIYADTSVFGGVFDAEFSSASGEFFAQIADGKFTLVTSVVVADEIANAPLNVRGLYGEHLSLCDIASVDANALALKNAYLSAGILGESSQADALHVAIASVNSCQAIVSWNFRHIVHFKKIPLYNAVNVINGYDHISINTPAEIINYAE